MYNMNKGKLGMNNILNKQKRQKDDTTAKKQIHKWRYAKLSTLKAGKNQTHSCHANYSKQKYSKFKYPEEKANQLGIYHINQSKTI